MKADLFISFVNNDKYYLGALVSTMIMFSLKYCWVISYFWVKYLPAIKIYIYIVHACHYSLMTC